MNLTSLLLRATLVIGILQTPAAIATDASPAKTPNSQLGSINGLPVFQVDGKPFFVLGAACDTWRSNRQDERAVEFFDAYQKMNATTVGVDIPWSKIEIEEDHYDFSFLDWFIKQAESHQLKLILKLLGSNVCGGVRYTADGKIISNLPSYIVDHPEHYQRMELKNVPSNIPMAGPPDSHPPMCPNDPMTLDREKKYIIQIAAHLKKTDVHHTVIMVQIENEFAFGEWKDAPPGVPVWKTWEATWQIRCGCPLCEKKIKSGNYRNELDFMFHSWANFVKVLTDAFVQVDPLPLYINCYGWPREASRIFLDTCPNLTLIGLDGVGGRLGSLTEHFDWDFAWVLTGRNVPFAAESPTDVATVSYNLDIIPYYMLIGRQGVGQLLWDHGLMLNSAHGESAGKTADTLRYEDVEVKRIYGKYGDALYPLKNALIPIAQARGTDSFIGWYEIRKFNPGLKIDGHGNYVPSEPDKPIVAEKRFVIREGKLIGETNDSSFKLWDCWGLTIQVSHTVSGILLYRGENKIILATAAGQFHCSGASDIKAESGRFEGESWVDAKPFPVVHQGNDFFINVETPVVLQLTYSPARPLKSASRQD
jgi:hypothetical protein